MIILYSQASISFSYEDTSKAFNAYLDEHGISRETTNAYTPQENGVTEHVNWTTNNLAQSMFVDVKETLKAKSLPPNLWPQAIQHSVWLKNHIITSSLNSKITPFQAYMARSHPSPHSIYSVAKCMPTSQRSTRPNLENAQLNVFT